MQFPDYKEKIKQNNFDFISSLSETNLLENESEVVKKYNASINNLYNKIGEFKAKKLTETELIIGIYQVFKHNREQLIAVYKNYISGANDHPKLKKSLKNILTHSKYFCRWAETLMDVSRLDGTPNDLSGNYEGSYLLKGYKDCTRNDNSIEVDKECVINGKGISVNPRLKPETDDPKHRAWGTLHRDVINKFESVINEWQKNPENDLPVFLSLYPQESLQQNKYYTYQEALSFLANSKDQKLFYPGSSQPIDTGGQPYMYVMDMKGNLFIHKEDQYVDGKRVGHAAFTRGKPVAGAGMVFIKKGKITNISSNSGHYCPGGYSLYRVVRELNRRQLLSEKCIIKDVAKNTPFEIVTKKPTYVIKKIKLSFIEFEKQFKELTKNDKIKEMDLSEKQNPLLLLEALSDVNQYLQQRSSETSWMRSKLFRSKNGNYYFERRKQFYTILTHLKDNQIALAKQTILASKSEYCNGYRNLFDQKISTLFSRLDDIQKKKIDISTNPFLMEKIKTFYCAYKKMDAFHNNTKHYFKNYSYFYRTQNTHNYNKMQKSLLDYKFWRQNLPEEDRNELMGVKNLEGSEQYNMSSR